eukprot:766692-Hanusia_phi.AAC.6
MVPVWNTKIWVFFPDPWPSKSDVSRRIIRSNVLIPFAMFITHSRDLGLISHAQVLEARRPSLDCNRCEGYASKTLTVPEGSQGYADYVEDVIRGLQGDILFPSEWQLFHKFTHESGSRDVSDHGAFSNKNKEDEQTLRQCLLTFQQRPLTNYEMRAVSDVKQPSGSEATITELWYRKPTTGRLTRLVDICRRACDQLGSLVRSIYGSIDEQTATIKQDKSAFTIADGLVQQLLTELLEGRVKAIVGEEDDAQVRLETRPMTVGSLSVPAEHESSIEEIRRGLQELGRELEEGGYQDLTVFIDPIDGTREFSTKKGEQCSICIGFADGGGQAVAGLVYRPIPQGWEKGWEEERAVKACSWAGGARSEGTAVGRLEEVREGGGRGFLTTNGKISGFVEKLMGELKEERVSSGGAGNKMLMLLEGKGGMYIQDRGVSRWDTCAAQAVIEAYGGVLCRLDRFLEEEKLVPYTYVKGERNADFVKGLAELTAYNARAWEEGGERRKAMEASDVKAYSNLNGLLAVSQEGRRKLGEVHQAMMRAKEKEEPSYD